MSSSGTLGLRLICSAIFALIFHSSTTTAAIIIPVGDITLFRDTSGQVVPLSVQGSVPVQGLNLNLTVEDGGPTITNVDVVRNTIFGGNNLGQSVLAAQNHAWSVTTVTNSGTVATDGVLAWITFDTHGVDTNSGSFELKLTDPAGSPTDFAGIPATIGVGHITMGGVPEPTSACLFGLASLGIVRYRRRDESHSN